MAMVHGGTCRLTSSCSGRSKIKCQGTKVSAPPLNCGVRRFIMRRVKSLERLHDFIATVVLCAPNRFPTRDYLPDDEQMNLDRAFEELRHGITFAPERLGSDTRSRLHAILDESYSAYQRGDDVGGAHLLQDFERTIFGR